VAARPSDQVDRPVADGDGRAAPDGPAAPDGRAAPRPGSIRHPLNPNAYYADNRTARDAATKFGVQVGIDTAANVLKEFWPDLERKLHRNRK